MSTTSAICQHSATYLDVDEVKCWSCNTSLTYPARPPGPEDEKDRRRGVRIAAGEHRRRDEPQAIQEVVQAEVVEVSQLLMCHCCREMLAPGDFYRNNSPTARNRGFRAWRCRACTAFRLRVQRQLDPEGTRQRGKERRARYQAALTPGQREMEKQRRDTTGNASAVRRYQARQDGRPVPLQRSGRLSLHIKPVCRVFQTCPLRPYCTAEAKGLE